MVPIVREFSGKMNLDSHASRVLPKDYIDALNITRNAANAQDVNSNVIGNQAVGHTLPDGNNECIGAFADELRNRVIYCIYNDAGFHEILSYSKATNTIATLIRSKTDTGGIDILNFTLTNRIRSVEVIHRDDGDLIFINDALNRPIGFNILTIRNYAPNITDDLIRLAKKAPLLPPVVSYDSDTTVKINNHRKKLYQFTYRIVYKDGYKSVFSDYSKTALPISGYSIVHNSDPSKNNVINVQVTAGGEDYQKIEIAFRECLGTTFGDFFLIDSIDRDDYGVDPTATYTYKFYNDGAYPPIPVRETEQLYDLIPDKANEMKIVNGNAIILGGITEGYNRMTRAQSNVQVSYRPTDTSPNETPTAGPPSLSYSLSASPSSSPVDYRLFYYVGAEVSDGYVYNAGFISVVTGSGQTTMDVSYTANSSDTRATVTTQLRSLIDAALGPNFDVQIVTDDHTIRIETHIFPSIGAQYFQTVTAIATQPQTVQGSDATWKWNSQYTLGLMYLDDYKKPLGLMSFRELEGDTNVYTVRIPNFNVNASNSYSPRVYVVTGTISHTPPTGAKYFQWIRSKNQTVSKFVQYITCKTETDNDFIYLCIENLDQYRLKNTGFVPSYVFTKGDRVRVMATVDNSGSAATYTGGYFQDDYEILGEVQREITPAVGETPAVMGRWLKVNKPSSTYAYQPTVLIEAYTPALSATESLQVFYQFGECYPIYVHENGNRYHTGNVTDQDASNAAHFDFTDGDVYFKFRDMYNETFSEALGVMTLGLMDANYSDSWDSAVNSDGRPVVLEPDAKREYNPSLLRFSLEYLTNTNINGLNRFYDLNYYEYSRNYGDIQRFSIWNNSLIIHQKLKVGKALIYQAIIKKINGQDVIESDELLSRISYYDGEYGIGDAWESLAEGNGAIYWWDNIRGVNCRLSQNGIDPLSEIYDAYQFGLENAVIGRRISGAFDDRDNCYIAAFAATTELAAKTLSYNEDRFGDKKGYLCFLSYLPDAIACLSKLTITWKSGVLYTHDSDTYNNFYGVQYDSYITGQFNDNLATKKDFNAISYQGTDGWSVPEIISNTFHNGSTRQSTYINAAEFRAEEGYFHSEVGRDINSTGGKVNGDFMKGEWATIKFKFTNASSFVYLLNVILKIAGSPKQPY